jgi:hypothetical protein
MTLRSTIQVVIKQTVIETGKLIDALYPLGRLLRVLRNTRRAA